MFAPHKAGEVALAKRYREVLSRCQVVPFSAAVASQAAQQTLKRWQVAVQLDPDNEDMSADVLQNRLSQLRRKVAACGVESECIRAVRGVGYRLCVPLTTS